MGSSARRTRTAIAVLLLGLAAPAAAQPPLEAFVDASPSNEPGFEGWTKYTVTFRWALPGDEVEPLDLYLDLRTFADDCDPANEVGFAFPAGQTPGLAGGGGGCAAEYGGRFRCPPGRDLPFRPLGGAVWFEPLDPAGCRPFSIGDGVFCFFSKSPPGPPRTHYNAAAARNPQGLFFGHAFGSLPVSNDGEGRVEEAVAINEFLVLPPEGLAEFYELFNRTAAPLDLNGWTLQTESGAFDAIADVLPAFGFLADSVFSQDAGKPRAGPLAASGAGNAAAPSQTRFGNFFDAGDVVSLRDDQNQLVDEVRYGNRGGAPISCPLRARAGAPEPPGGVHGTAASEITATSTNLHPDGDDQDDPGGDWNLGTPTPGGANGGSPPALGSSLRLNSIYAAGTGTDAIELFNPTGSHANVDGWHLSDGSVILPIGNGGGLPVEAAGGRLTLYQGRPGSFDFELDFEDVLYLYDENLVRLDQVGWSRVPALFPDSCIVRSPDGAGPADGYDWPTSGGDVNLFYEPCALQSPTTDAGDGAGARPGLSAPVPNPARDEVTLRLTLGTRAPAAGPIRAGIFDLSGRRVRTLLATEAVPGGHLLRWRGRDDAGRRVPAGIYFVRLDGVPVRAEGIRRLVWLQ